VPVKRLNVTIIDLTTRGPDRRPFSRLMNANYASIMPQVVAVWCAELGAKVHFVCYTGSEDLDELLDVETDVLFVSAFTLSAHTAYALSNLFRRKGAITVLGGPHARCYPEDAEKYFDYVLGFTSKAEIEEIMRERAPHRPLGRRLASLKQPTELPGVRERWPYIEATVKKAPYIKMVPMIGSLGCPYTCKFCIDSTVDYQPLEFKQITADMRFLRTKFKKPLLAWHDPNFGIRFDDYMGAMEEAVPPGSVESVAESSLSILSEPNLKRMQKNGFVGMLPGIESWFDFGNKSKTTRVNGLEKVKQVAEHVNLVLRHIPYVQTNFVLGLDTDFGAEPFELTKTFVDLVPGAYPAYSMLTCYGRAAPMNLDLQRAGRVLPFPFHFLDSNHATNVRPLNYGWKEYYDLTRELTRHTISARGVWRRMIANKHWTTKVLHFVRGAASDRVAYLDQVREGLASDLTFRRFYEGESRIVPDFYMKRIKASLGPLWDALPEGALSHDHNAYLHATPEAAVAAAE
jgi:hypothetical protein